MPVAAGKLGLSRFFQGLPCWSSRSRKKMTSSCDSPVTPTIPQRSSVMQRVSSKGQSGVAFSSEFSWRPQLTAEERASCKEALKLFKRKKAKPELIDKEFLSLATSRISRQELLGRLTVAQLSSNQDKNRYMDVIPFDDTRVVLEPTRGSQSDYINASFIEASTSYLPTFIATQGPLQWTVVDFWEMVMQQRCPVIIMLTSLFDGNLEKCAPYFPSGVNQHQVYGRLKVTNKTVSSSSCSIAKRVFEVQAIEEANEPPLDVLHLEYLQWSDHGVPSSTRPIRELFRCVSSIPHDAGPFVVHCSAGIGRSGTYITVDHSVRRILRGDMSAVNVEDTVRQFRHQRMGMVQTKAQYHFCYAAIIDELEDLINTAADHSGVSKQN